MMNVSLVLNSAFAQEEGGFQIAALMARINQYVLNPLIQVMFVVAFVVFLYGMLKFFRNKDSEEAIKEGKQHMIYGIVGMVIMVSVFGIMQFLINTLGVKGIEPNQAEIGNLSGR